MGYAADQMFDVVQQQELQDHDYRRIALEKLETLRRYRSPCKQWRNTGYFDVPGYIMQDLAKEGKCETRKLSGHSPREYRP